MLSVGMCVEICRSSFRISKPYIKVVGASTDSLGRFPPEAEKRVGLGTNLRLCYFRQLTEEIGTAERGSKQESPHMAWGLSCFARTYELIRVSGSEETRLLGYVLWVLFS
jgi:hypothetical protein